MTKAAYRVITLNSDLLCLRCGSLSMHASR
ncbi:hypothetical protein WP8S18E04_19840 [Aeromonas caviae]|nr:hypothetical protein WP3S18E02_22620 [Aeromonas caviae]BBT66600.1 hypothetical protein WP8S18E04_19840 [Aeromonas caviae]